MTRHSRQNRAACWRTAPLVAVRPRRAAALRDATAGRVDGPAGGSRRRYESIFLLATMPLVRIAAVIGMCSAALLSLV